MPLWGRVTLLPTDVPYSSPIDGGISVFYCTYLPIPGAAIYIPTQLMAMFAIPRHGSRPSPLPKKWDITKPLYGAINIGFFDGHAGTIPLEQLWQLYWSADWQPPAKRPGLK